VRTGPIPRTSGPEPRTSVTCPTRTPATSVIALGGPAHAPSHVRPVLVQPSNPSLLLCFPVLPLPYHMLACRADKASAPSQVKKQFQEKNLYEKVVIPAFTSQTGENQRLSPPSSNFWFLPCSHPRITPAPMRMTTTAVMALLLPYRLLSRCACVRIRCRHPSCRRSLLYSS
jgi:hypothetical protein